MSPEQAQGRNQELDPRSDQCALGLILHELVCLRAAIDGRQPLEVLHNAATGKRLPVQHAYRRPVLREIAAIIQRATAYEPDRRYSSVRELAADLRRYLRGEAVKAHPDNLWQKLQRFVVRYRQATLATILGLVAVGASGFGLLHYQQEQALVAQRRHEHRLLVLLDAVAERGDFIPKAHAGDAERTGKLRLRQCRGHPTWRCRDRTLLHAEPFQEPGDRAGRPSSQSQSLRQHQLRALGVVQAADDA